MSYIYGYVLQMQVRLHLLANHCCLAHILMKSTVSDQHKAG